MVFFFVMDWVKVVVYKLIEIDDDVEIVLFNCSNILNCNEKIDLLLCDEFDEDEKLRRYLLIRNY